MAKNKVSEWSSTPANNTDIANIDIAEGCSPSGINNAIREMMAQIKDLTTGADGDNLVVGGTLTVDGASTLTGAVTASSTLGVTGAITAGSTLAVTGAITATGGLTGAITSSNATITGGTITGITDLAVADGGTGSSTLTANAVLLGNGTSALQSVAPGTSGHALVSNGTTWTSAFPTVPSLSTATGSAPSYSARAWVNFKGNTSADVSGTYTQSGTTVTVSVNSHGLTVGQVIYSDITSGTGVDGAYTVASVTDANTFTYTAGTSLTTLGTITLKRREISASGNVSSITYVSIGIYYINFTEAMPDANYSVSGSGAGTSALTGLFIGIDKDVSLTTKSMKIVCRQIDADPNAVDGSTVTCVVFR